MLNTTNVATLSKTYGISPRKVQSCLEYHQVPVLMETPMGRGMARYYDEEQALTALREDYELPEPEVEPEPPADLGALGKELVAIRKDTTDIGQHLADVVKGLSVTNLSVVVVGDAFDALREKLDERDKILFKTLEALATQVNELHAQLTK